MTNTAVLIEKIKASGLKMSYIAKEMNLSRESLNQKIKNKSDFRAGEINELCRILGIEDLLEKESIFFAR